MSERRLRTARAATAGLVLSVLTFAADTANATTATGPTTQSLRHRAAVLAKQISGDSRQLQITGEQYDQANVTYAKAERELQAIKQQLHTDNLRLAAASTKMKRAVVTAYVYGVGAQAEVNAVLSGKSISSANTLATYASVATTELHVAVTNVIHAKAALTSNERYQESVARAAKSAETAAITARRQAHAIELNSRAALSQVRGQLAALIAEQAAAAARAAAAAAAAAKTAQLRSAAQAQAQAQANLAQTIANNNAASGTQPVAPDGTAVGGVSGATTPGTTTPGVATPGPTTLPSTPATGSVAQATAAAAAAAVSAAQSASNIGAPVVLLGAAGAAGAAAVTAAKTELGVPYVWGGASSTIGFDCSGLTMVAWQAGGVTLTHSAYDQYLHASPIPVVNKTITLEPGDLLFYYFPDDGGQPVTHVTMYVGDGPYGANTVIAAPETGENVMYQPLYWGGFVGAGRP